MRLITRVARFFLVQHTKTRKIYQITIKCTKWPQNILDGGKNRPTGHKINQHLPLQDPPKFTQIGLFGLKICHLATLLVKIYWQIINERYNVLNKEQSRMKFRVSKIRGAKIFKHFLSTD
jgi:hypothetical protein